MLVCLAGSLAVGTVVHAVTPNASEGPYLGIVERNMFGLKAPPPPPDPESTKPPPPKITLNGIMTITGKKRAVLKLPGPAPKPGEQPKGEQSYILSEGEGLDGLTVTKIDEKAGAVKVDYNGTPIDLDFEKNGPKMAAAAPPGTPGLPMPALGPGGVPAPAPGVANPATASPFGAGMGMKQYPARNLRLPTPDGSGAAAAPATGAALGNPVPAAAGYVGTPAAQGSQSLSLPAGGLLGAATQQKPLQNWPPERHDLSRDEQTVLLMAQKQAMGNDPNAPPFPPLPGDAPTQTPQPQQTTPGNQNHMPTLPGMPIPPGGGRPF
jgi:hypothetical protein